MLGKRPKLGPKSVAKGGDLPGLVVGAGSTITKDVPPGTLAVARGKQATIEGWKRPVKGGGRRAVKP